MRFTDRENAPFRRGEAKEFDHYYDQNKRRNV